MVKTKQWGNFFEASSYFILISAYCGEVLCDILPMDAPSLLLSRPWMFDNHVIYDGYANTYSLKHNGKSITLAPLPLPKPKPGKGSKKSPHKSETSKECATSKRKPRNALLMVKPNISEGVKSLPLESHQELEDETSKAPILRSPCPSKWFWKKSLMQVIKPQVTPFLSMIILKHLVMSILRSTMSSWGLGELFNALMFFQRSSTTPTHSRRGESFLPLVYSNPRMVKGMQG